MIGTETIEHDYRVLFETRPLPRFSGDAAALAELRAAAQAVSGFRVAFDIIASGDEDVVTLERGRMIRAETGAVCVAWEGSGAARAAAFNGLRSLELCAVTDAATRKRPRISTPIFRSRCETSPFCCEPDGRARDCCIGLCQTRWKRDAFAPALCAKREGHRVAMGGRGVAPGEILAVLRTPTSPPTLSAPEGRRERRCYRPA